MIELQWHDLQWLLRRIPPQVAAEVRKRPGQVLIAGGCIRACVASEPINDFDLFVPTMEIAKDLANELVKDKDRAKDDDGLLPGIHKSDNAFTIKAYKPPVQIIHRWMFQSPEECINSFDFTVAKAVVWHDGDEWKSMISERFYADLAAKRLIYTSPLRIEEVGGSLLRVLKFYQRGYRIPLDSLGAVIARLCSAIDHDKIRGSESQMAKVLTGLLVEVDPNIDPDHIAHLPSETKTTDEKAT